jgi:hypothetical protein
MVHLAKGFGTITLLGMALLGYAVTGAQAQVGNPYANPAVVYVSPYGYRYDPWGLHGAADVIRAQGDFLVKQQQAYKMKEEVLQERIVTRRKKQEQWLWERANLPTAEDERQRELEEQLKHSREKPPVTEMWSAATLNTLLEDLRSPQTQNAAAGAARLTKDLLDSLNLTNGKDGANFGMLKGGKVAFWPPLLRREVFAKDREQLDKLVAQAVKEIRQGQSYIDVEVLDKLTHQVNGVRKTVQAQARTLGDKADWEPADYMDAKRFLDQFDAAIRGLRQPHAADYVNGKWAAQGTTVAELVTFMTDRGLQFAPATSGGEWAYRALHRLLADYSKAAGAPVQKRR